MATALTHEYRVRKNFGKIERIIDIPNLIQMQKESYSSFLQREVPPEGIRASKGLQEVFKSVFPIEDFSGTASLEFERYSFGEVKYDVDECLARGMTYEAPLKIVVRLEVYDINKETGTRSIRDIKEQEIYFGTLPLMTENGTFIVNGTERVVVSQLHRSPGIFFDHDRGKTHSSGKILYSSRIIPLRGSWLDLEFDPKDILYVRIDRRRKLPVTVLLKALGYSACELLNFFYPSETIFFYEMKAGRPVHAQPALNAVPHDDVPAPKGKQFLAKKGQPLDQKAVAALQKAGIEHLPMDPFNLLGRVLASDVIDEDTGEIVVERNTEIAELTLSVLYSRNIKEIDVRLPATESIYLAAKGKAERAVNPALVLGTAAPEDVKGSKSKEALVTKGQPLTRILLRRLARAGVDRLPVATSALVGRALAHDVTDDAGEIIAHCDQVLDDKLLKEFFRRGVKQFELRLTTAAELVFIDGGKQTAERQVHPEAQVGTVAQEAVTDPKSKDQLVAKGQMLSGQILRRLHQAGIERLPVAPVELVGRVLAGDVAHPDSGEILARSGQILDDQLLPDLFQQGVKQIELRVDPAESIVLSRQDRTQRQLDPGVHVGIQCPEDIVHPETGDLLAKKGRKLGKQRFRRLQKAGIEWLPMELTSLVGRVLAQDVIDYSTGSILAECNNEIDEELLDVLQRHGIRKIELLHIESLSIRATLAMDKVYSRKDALIEIYRRLRPSNPPTLEVATEFFENLFFNPNNYDLSEVGRFKLNLQLELKDRFGHKLTDESLKKLAAEVESDETLDRLQQLKDREFIKVRLFVQALERTIGKRQADQLRAVCLKCAKVTPLEASRDLRTLRPQDILVAVNRLVQLKDASGSVDDIDNLGNRRVRAVGELLENQYRIGLVRMERAIKERMTLQEIDALMPHDLINAKPVSAVVKEFFGTSQLSQFMDQTNPLSEITHKRRLSALGPGGLTRERAGFEVRDVHTTHYGRICPIETPEGPNIGLIVSLSTYADVNPYGFIETPYRKVTEAKASKERLLRLTGPSLDRLAFEISSRGVCDRLQPMANQEFESRSAFLAEVEKLIGPHLADQFGARIVKHARQDVTYLSAMDEKDDPIAQANAPLDDDGRFIRDQVSARKAGEFLMLPPKEIRYMDVSPNQLVSVAASLIPFLEHDDANRALMGSNMQRQAVPLIQTRAPLVGTGIERIVARDSGVTIIARRDGVVEYVDATRIVVRAAEQQISRDSGVDIYKLTKFQRSNQNTCINQKPLVGHGDFVMKEQVIADGPSTDRGELALGRNAMVAFMSWGGYNFEDSILVSERIVKEDVFTSIHIEEFEVVARDTKLGKEEITRDIPNVGEEALRNLDESGIVRIGAYIKPNDILVGKVTPKGESQLTPEEKLLRAIFGEKASDVKDTSLRVQPGVEGIIIDAKVFSRKSVEQDERTRMIENEEIARLNKDQRDELDIIQKSNCKRLAQLLAGKVCDKEVKPKDGKKVYVAKGEAITEERLMDVPPRLWPKLSVQKDKKVTAEEGLRIAAAIKNIHEGYMEQVDLVKSVFEEKINKLKRGDELPPGVIKMVKVYVAVKRKLQVGDKMAGRHGNKGVVSRILPVEDMPYFADGSTVDIVLNPLGVPSRMNVGQVMETHLGWAAKGLGEQLARMIEEYRSQESLKEKLQRIYNQLEFDDYFKEADDKELQSLIPDLREGLHVASPVFDGAEEREIRAFLSEAGLPETGQSTLFDGRTGEPFDQQVTVGIMYMLKLHHLVDDKIHARSIGPYSLVTQQPLGGKAQFGGQRLGEMEVWAMEAYGAAHALQEFLTVKSDDVAGRTRMYEKIVKGENTLEAGLPESFNVLIKELQALALDVRLIEEEGD